MNNTNTIELLAPAGDYDTLRAVLGAGADAVYAGGKLFGARAYAGNFDQDELIRAIHEVHVLGKKLYLTVNTLLKNKELYGELFEYLAPLYEAGLDAVLVQDFGVFSFIRRYFPDLPVHASTQMTITGAEGMKLLRDLGVSRAVAARELSLDEIRLMHTVPEVEIETFIHGALCYSYSGRCLFSSMLGGRSGNRGRCAQPCRLPYEVYQKKIKSKETAESTTPISLKDMNTIDILPDIAAAGVASLKIEGRMKQKEYAAGVTAIYRKYLDIIKAPGFRRQDYHVLPEDRTCLTELFSRGGSCAGYYQTYHGSSMIDFHGAKKTGEVNTEVRQPKTGITGRLSIQQDRPMTLTVMAGDKSVSVCGNTPLIAEKKPVTRDDVFSRMERLGNTPFFWERLNIDIAENLFIPMKDLNDLRREAADLLYEELWKSYCRELPQFQQPASPDTIEPSGTPDEASLVFSVSCEDIETAKIMLREPEISRIYVPLRILSEVLEEKQKSGSNAEIYVSLPMITRRISGDASTVLKDCLNQGAKGFLVRDPEMLSVIIFAGLTDYAVADASLYTWNNEAIEFLRSLGITRNTVPLELNRHEIRGRDNRGSEMIIYGNLPLMVSAQCVRSNCRMKAQKGNLIPGKCTGNRELLYLKDRYGKDFPVQCECTPWKGEDTEKNSMCYNIIYNSLPFGLPDEHESVVSSGIHNVRLVFTVETPQEALDIFRSYRDMWMGRTKQKTAGSEKHRNLTKGHYNRGAL